MNEITEAIDRLFEEYKLLKVIQGHEDLDCKINNSELESRIKSYAQIVNPTYQVKADIFEVCCKIEGLYDILKLKKEVLPFSIVNKYEKTRQDKNEIECLTSQEFKDIYQESEANLTIQRSIKKLFA